MRGDGGSAAEFTRARVKSRAQGNRAPAATRTTRAGIGARRRTEDPRRFGIGRGRASGAGRMRMFVSAGRRLDDDCRLGAAAATSSSGGDTGAAKASDTSRRMREAATEAEPALRRRWRREVASAPARGEDGSGTGPAIIVRVVVVVRGEWTGARGRVGTARGGDGPGIRENTRARGRRGARPPSSPVCVVGTRGREWSGVGRDEGATADAALFRTGKGRRRTSRRACSPLLRRARTRRRHCGHRSSRERARRSGG